MRLELSTQQLTASPGLTSGLSQWRVGAIVEAIAVRSVEDGQLWLTIGATRVPARIASGDAAGPANGERLQLRVLRDSPVIALETVMADDSEANTVNEGLRHFLPRQTSPAPLLANLAFLAKNGGASTPIAKQITDALQRLWRALPDAEELQTPEGLAAAVKRSGVFLENQLASGNALELKQVASGDLKALLSALKQTLARNGATAQPSARTNSGSDSGPLPTLRSALAPLDRASASLANIDSPQSAVNELASQTDGALARINTLQLVNADNAAHNPAWLLELPLRRDGQAEALRFRFERNRNEQNPDAATWTVEAAMDVGVGAIHARVSLQGKHVSIQLRSDSSTLSTELQSRSKELVEVLKEDGLQVDRIQCQQGLPSDRPDIASTPLLAKPLLDIRV